MLITASHVNDNRNDVKKLRSLIVPELSCILEDAAADEEVGDAKLKIEHWGALCVESRQQFL